MTKAPDLIAAAINNGRVREGVLRSVPLADLLDELARRQLDQPFTGIPERTAETLVGMFTEEDRVTAVLRVAHYAQVAVAWLDRYVIEAKLGTALTEPQWDRMAEWLEEYDEWLENSGADDSIHHFVHDYLVKKASLAWGGEGVDQLVDVEVDR